MFLCPSFFLTEEQKNKNFPVCHEKTADNSNLYPLNHNPTYVFLFLCRRNLFFDIRTKFHLSVDKQFVNNSNL